MTHLLRTLLPLALLLTALPCQAFAAEGDDAAETYLLRYKFHLGEVLRYQVKHAANVRSTIEETTKEVETRSESVKAWKVTDLLPDGSMEFIHVVESIRMTNRTPEHGEVTYDSSTDEKPPLGYESAARAVGVPLSLIRIAPSGKILHREEKHPQPPASDDLPITLELPEEPIAVGEKWNSTYEIDTERKSGAKLKVRTRRLCELESVDAGVATIGVKYQVLTPITPHVEAQLAQRLTEGKVRFDIDTGRVLAQQHDVDRHIIAFAGPTSSMHYQSRLTEKLLDPQETVAKKP